MATGVKPRDEDHEIQKSDLENLEEALKNKQFRDMLFEYFEEVRDPANQAIYQNEMTQLEKERGYDITFINPKGGYVIKTSVAGDRKAFINICSNDNVNKPSCTVKEVDGCKGMNWSIPYTLIPPSEDYDQKRKKCIIYDVVFHPDTLRMAKANERFRELVNNTAFDALKSAYNVELDCNNLRFPKSEYKGMTRSAVIRNKDPNYKPPSEEEISGFSEDMLEKLYPQKNYLEQEVEEVKRSKRKNNSAGKNIQKLKPNDGYTTPKYVIKQQKSVDIQDYTFEKNSKQYAAIPSHIVVEVNLPLLSSTKECLLDIKNRKFSLKSEKPAKYNLNLTLPYSVNDDLGNAKFDQNKRLLVVTLPVIRKDTSDVNLKSDSGVDSEDYTPSDEEVKPLISEISSTENPVTVPAQPEIPKEHLFLDPSIGYTLPTHTHNILDDMMAFTFHVKNTDPGSVVVKKDNNKILIKFTSIGAGFVPAHYAALILFNENVKLEEVGGEAWDNNVILQIELNGVMPQNYQIGLSEEALTCEIIDHSLAVKSNEEIKKVDKDVPDPPPVVEVTNFGSETNIVVSSNQDDEDDEPEPETSETNKNEREIVWVEDSTNENYAKSILRKPVARSLSESSVGDVASSMDYISSDCIPEESSLKKTVRFNNVIAKQFYRHNSSIEGQKRKNQRKKIKKQILERRKSESEAEEENGNINIKGNKSKTKSAIKERRDSGVADTSDTDSKNTPQATPDTTDNKGKITTEISDTANGNAEINNGNIRTNSAYVFRDSEKKSKRNKIKKCDIKENINQYYPVNKGKYGEVKFRNDLIFDLDM